jgi:Xaa-Pro aminopeptidase
VILFDWAAEYANYNADMSRSIPVNGRFTKRQRDVYDAVLRVMRAATKMLVAGTVWNEYHDEVGKIMTGELIDLGLLKNTRLKSKTLKCHCIKNTLCTAHRII